MTVTKNITCEEVITGVSIQQAVTPCQLLEELVNENLYIISVEGNNPVPSQFPDSPEGTEVTLGPGNYIVSEQFTGDVISLVAQISEQFPNIIGLAGGSTFSGDCTINTGLSATGTIEAGESQICNIENNVIFQLRPLP